MLQYNKIRQVSNIAESYLHSEDKKNNLYLGGIIMKIKKGFVIQKVGGSYLACATGRLAAEFSAIVKLNSTGVFLWNKIAESQDISRDALVEEFRSACNIERSIAERDVDGFIATLSENGILE